MARGQVTWQFHILQKPFYIYPPLMMMDELLPKKYHIILEIATGDYHSLNQIADCIGITKQGVYEYLKKMREEGLIEVIDGTYRTTVKGIELLFSYLNDLEDYLEKKKRRLARITLSSAIAGDVIRKGDTVWLAIENGYVHAYTCRRTPSSAEAAEDARKGEDVAVRNVKGIIELSSGVIFLISLPSITEGGSKTADLEKMSGLILNIAADKTGITDIIGKVALEKANIPYDFEYGAVQTALEMAQRGLNVALVGERREIQRAIAKIEEYNASALDDITYKHHEIPHQ